MTGVQALERAAPDLPMLPGKVARREFEYIRHGTQTLIAAFDVATGQVIGTVGDTRTEQDYASFLERLFATGTSTTGWRVVADNLNTHVSTPERKSLTEAAGLSGCAGVKFRQWEALCGDRKGLGDEGRGAVCAGPVRGSD